MIKAVIFDMDGVLIDTVELGFRVRKKLLAQFNVDLDLVPDPQHEGHRAASLKNLLKSVYEHTGITIDHDRFAALARRTMRQELQSQGIAADPALIAFLDELKEHKIRCAVASSSLRESIDIKLDVLGIKDYFSVIVSGSDVQEHKPSPDTYLVAMKKLDLSANECIVFEDSLTGIAAARAAGCRVIGFTQYNQPRVPLRDVVATVTHWKDVNLGMIRRL